jgi:hypothetical protein
LKTLVTAKISVQVAAMAAGVAREVFDYDENH